MPISLKPKSEDKFTYGCTYEEGVAREMRV
jgi:hypothetical protein